MSVSRLMTYGVYALGALMVILGLSFVSAGVPIVRMEIGWAEIISGSVAASAGCVVIVLGLLLSSLEAMQSTLDRLATGGVPASFEETLPFRPTLSEPFEAEAPETPVMPAAVPPAPDVRPIHPLAPAARREPPPAPVAEVQPEPGMTAALHPAEDEIGPPPTAPTHEAVAEAPALDDGAPALVHAEDEEIAQSPPVAAPDRVADPIADAPPSRLRSTFLSSMLARRPAPSTQRPKAPGPASPVPVPVQTADVAPRTMVDLSSGWDDEPVPPPSVEPPPGAEPNVPADHHPDAPASTLGNILDLGTPSPAPIEPVAEEPAAPVPPPPAPPVPDPLAPVVVGRYNAGTASYVMYSNGMIEVETEHGTHQFASMQDLKAFIERRDARAS